MKQTESNKTKLSKVVSNKKSDGVIKKILKHFFGAMFLIFVLVVILYLFVIRPIKIVDNSMSPAFCSGEYMWLEKYDYYFHSPKRGDVVIFKSVINPGQTIGRIVGLPNETVSLKPGEIKIGGKILDESYTNWGNFASLSNNWPTAQVSLKGNEYFVFSDNQMPTKSETITTDQNVIQHALQTLLMSSVIFRNEILGKITPKAPCR